MTLARRWFWLSLAHAFPACKSLVSGPAGEGAGRTLYAHEKAANPLEEWRLKKDGGPYWTRTSDLFHVKETL